MPQHFQATIPVSAGQVAMQDTQRVNDQLLSNLASNIANTNTNNERFKDSMNRMRQMMGKDDFAVGSKATLDNAHTLNGFLADWNPEAEKGLELREQNIKKEAIRKNTTVITDPRTGLPTGSIVDNQWVPYNGNGQSQGNNAATSPASATNVNPAQTQAAQQQTNPYANDPGNSLEITKPFTKDMLATPLIQNEEDTQQINAYAAQNNARVLGQDKDEYLNLQAKAYQGNMNPGEAQRHQQLMQSAKEKLSKLHKEQLKKNPKLDVQAQDYYDVQKNGGF